jgi:hypothetical protein
MRASEENEIAERKAVVFRSEGFILRMKSIPELMPQTAKTKNGRSRGALPPAMPAHLVGEAGSPGRRARLTWSMAKRCA